MKMNRGTYIQAAFTHPILIDVLVTMLSDNTTVAPGNREADKGVTIECPGLANPFIPSRNGCGSSKIGYSGLR